MLVNRYKNDIGVPPFPPSPLVEKSNIPKLFTALPLIRVEGGKAVAMQAQFWDQMFSTMMGNLIIWMLVGVQNVQSVQKTTHRY